MKDLQHCCVDLLCHVLQISEKCFLTQFFPQFLMTFGSHLQPFLPSCNILRQDFMLATLIVNVIRKFVFIYSGAQPGQGRGGLVGLGCFYKHFVKNTWKKCLAEKNLGVFSPRYSKNYILNGKFNSKMGTIRAFFTKSAHFFLIFKIRQGRPPLSPPPL